MMTDSEQQRPSVLVETPYRVPAQPERKNWEATRVP